MLINEIIARGKTECDYMGYCTEGKPSSITFDNALYSV